MLIPKILIFSLLTFISIESSFSKDIIIKGDDGKTIFFIKSDAITMDKINKFLERGRAYFYEVDQSEIKQKGKKIYHQSKDHLKEIKSNAKDAYRKEKREARSHYLEVRSYVKEFALEFKNGAKVIFYDTPKKLIKEFKEYFDI